MTDKEFIGKHIEVEKSLCEAAKKAKTNAKSEVLKAFEDVRAEIHKLAPERGMWEIDGDKVKEAVIETLIDVDAIIDRKIKEIKHECSSCTHSDEVDGEHCYECVKGLANNFEADAGEELTNPFGDNSEIFGG